jgi:hypothetical protein
MSFPKRIVQFVSEVRADGSAQNGRIVSPARALLWNRVIPKDKENDIENQKNQGEVDKERVQSYGKAVEKIAGKQGGNDGEKPFRQDRSKPRLNPFLHSGLLFHRLRGRRFQGRTIGPEHKKRSSLTISIRCDK